VNKKKFKRVLVVLGGNSGERQVSLDSGRACIKALRKKKYIVSTFDPKFKNLNLIDKRKIDVIFNALHGKGGEDGLAQSYFEYLGVPYTHSGVVSSYNAMDKQISKIMFKRNKILTPKYFIINSNQFTTKILISLLKKNRIDFPVVIKPTNEGSSIGVKIIQNLKNLQRSIIQLRKNYSPLIIEKFIGGQEIQVAVINNKPIGAIELIPKRSFYDYKAKYTKAAKTEHIMPAKLGKKNYESVLKIAMRAHRVLNCKGVTRADFKFFDKRFYLLEINTQPGMTNLSLVPEIANYYGIEFPDLIEQILLDASINR
tara:strand:- start:335 stop:1273 length:939 start_codon:yes stop_codon:yes gene_type:complete